MDAGADRKFRKPFKRKELLDFPATTLVERGLLKSSETLITRHEAEEDGNHPQLLYLDSPIVRQGRPRGLLRLQGATFR